MADNTLPHMAPSPEVERALAGERRKERRVRRALWAGGVLAVIGLGAFVWWQDQKWVEEREAAERARLSGPTEQTERLARRVQEISSALGRCRAALRAGELDQATGILDELDHFPGGVPGSLNIDRFRLRAELALLRELEWFDARRWSAGGLRPEDPAVTAGLAEAMAWFGIQPGARPPEGTAMWLDESYFRDRVMAALDRWLLESRSRELLPLLQGFDPDPFRTRVREAVAAGDKAGLGKLGDRPEALAQPAWFAVALADCEAVPVGRRRQILEAAQLAKPADIGVLMALGGLVQSDRGPAEAVAAYRAAVAAAPRNPQAHNLLGLSLLQLGDEAAAVAAFRESVRLDPTNPAFHAALGDALLKLGDRDGAAVCFREAVRLDPDHAAAREALKQLVVIAPPPREVTRP